MTDFHAWIRRRLARVACFLGRHRWTYRNPQSTRQVCGREGCEARQKEQSRSLPRQPRDPYVPPPPASDLPMLIKRLRQEANQLQNAELQTMALTLLADMEYTLDQDWPDGFPNTASRVSYREAHTFSSATGWVTALISAARLVDGMSGRAYEEHDHLLGVADSARQSGDPDPSLIHSTAVLTGAVTEGVTAKGPKKKKSPWSY